MPLTKFFWFMILITFAMVMIQIIGFPVIEYIILLLIIDVVTVEISREMHKSKAASEMKEGLLKRIASIEELSGRIAFHLEKNPHEIRGALEAHKTEFKNDMDRLAAKAIDIENNLHKLKRNVGEAFALFDDRINRVEKKDVKYYPDI